MGEFETCPHCGNRPYANTNKTSDGQWLASVNCKQCNATVWAVSSDLEEAHRIVAERWNTRYEPTCHFVENSDSFKFRCDNCGYASNYYGYYDFCPGCGRKVVD